MIAYPFLIGKDQYFIVLPYASAIKIDFRVCSFHFHTDMLLSVRWEKDGILRSCR